LDHYSSGSWEKSWNAVMKKLFRHRLMLAGLYLIVGLGLTILGREQVRTKNLGVISGKTIFSQKKEAPSPSGIYMVLKMIKLI
jgi:hypothetical protein